MTYIRQSFDKLAYVILTSCFGRHHALLLQDMLFLKLGNKSTVYKIELNFKYQLNKFWCKNKQLNHGFYETYMIERVISLYFFFFVITLINHIPDTYRNKVKKKSKHYRKSTNNRNVYLIVYSNSFSFMCSRVTQR